MDVLNIYYSFESQILSLYVRGRRVSKIQGKKTSMVSTTFQCPRAGVYFKVMLRRTEKDIIYKIELHGSLLFLLFLVLSLLSCRLKRFLLLYPDRIIHLA